MPKVTCSICDCLVYVVSSQLTISLIPPYSAVPANFKETYEVAFSELMIGIYNNSTTNTLGDNLLLSEHVKNR
jgi:hypothetical protein